MPKISLPNQILAGLFLGVACGIFFGELCAPLDRIGSAFIMLLKMPVLLYMATALIHAIGSLSLSGAKSLLKHSIAYYLLFWTSILVVIFSMPLSFPSVKLGGGVGEFLSQAPETPDLLKLFIPSNPIHALANNIIPAVVLFSLLFGYALMKSETKQPLLDILASINEALMRITRTVTKLSPVGVFALIAASVGTISLNSMEKIEIYLFSYLGTSLLASFWIFPTLVKAFTHVPRREFLNKIKPALLLGFTTGNNLVALPYLIDGLEELAEEYEIEKEAAQGTIASMVPISYNFPTAGNLLTILFVLFLGFFYGVDLGIFDKAKLLFLSLPSLFGAATATYNAVSFLIDEMRLPMDGLALFFETLPLSRNFQTLVSLVGMATVTTLVTFSSAEKVTVSIRRLSTAALQCFGGLILTLVVLSAAMPDLELRDSVYQHLSIGGSSELSILEPFDPSKISPPPLQVDLLQKVRDEGVLRVGFHPDALPVSYFNKEGELVGFDIAVLQHFAEYLGVSLKLRSYEFIDLEKLLNSGQADIACSGLVITPERLETLRFSRPYSAQPRCLLVYDYRRDEFKDAESFAQRSDLKIGVLAGSAYEKDVGHYFPRAQIVPLAHVDDLITRTDIDAFYWISTGGTTWSIQHPRFSSVVPEPGIGHSHLAFALPSHAESLQDLLNYWLDLMEEEDWIKEQESKWIRGEEDKKNRRWSIIRDVLHWVN